MLGELVGVEVDNQNHLLGGDNMPDSDMAKSFSF